ncbi:hypothetical protein [Aeromicrobium sp. Leaf350]|uniref:hypothetical protein n=1 Tax=Aeromicrobium sp. Leaf350 TaxID=2876565 RepID=UPI001E559D63|nr:hypothetical protein [Aeromicrobium sp. Leaf350]
MSSAKTTHTAPAWRRPQVLAIAGVLVLALAAGGWFFFLRDASGAYCDDLQTWKEKSEETLAPDADLETSATFLAGSVERRLDGAEQFSKEGPDEIKADWKLFHERLLDVVEVFEKIGYDLTDSASVQKFAADLQSGALTEIDPALQTEAAEVQAKLADSESTDAVDAITKDAKDRCEIDLVLSTSTS